MGITITKVTSKSQLRKFVRYPFELYKDCRNWVPALDGDEFDTFNPQLEENFKVQTLFEQYEVEPYMRRRTYKKSLGDRGVESK